MIWRVGGVTITKIVELEVTGGSRFILPQATPEAILPIGWLQPDFADERGRLRMSIHALVVEAPGRRIVVDTCLGNDKENRRIPGIGCRRVFSPTLPWPVTLARRSTPLSAPIFMSIMSAGTRCWSTGAGS